MLSCFQKTTHAQQQIEDSPGHVAVLPAPSLGKAAPLQEGRKGQKVECHPCRPALLADVGEQSTLCCLQGAP